MSQIKQGEVPFVIDRVAFHQTVMAIHAFELGNVVCLAKRSKTTL